MTHIINNSKDRICCSSCIGKSINTGGRLPNAEGSDQDWEKDLGRRAQGKVTCPIPVSTVTSNIMFRTQATQRIKIRSIPWKFSSAQKQNLQGHYRILLHKWVSSTSKILFHLFCQTIGCPSPGLRQNQKDFSNLLPWFWSHCHQRKTFSISIIHYYIIFSNYAWNYTECSRWNEVNFGPI